MFPLISKRPHEQSEAHAFLHREPPITLAGYGGGFRRGHKRCFYPRDAIHGVRT